MDCGANDELMDTMGLGGGGVDNLRGEIGEDGRRSPGFGDTGRTYGSSLDTVPVTEEEVAPIAEVFGVEFFNGGGGDIIPLL